MSRKVCIISLTPVTDEPRVLRQSKAMADVGWEVTVCGFQGVQPPPSWWTNFVDVEHVVQVPTLTQGLGDLERIKQCMRFLGSRVSHSLAEGYYWDSAGYAGIFEHIATVEGVRCDLAIAHDYFTAPIAMRLANLSNAPFVIDAHEYARGQYMHDTRWRLIERPWVDAMQRRLLPAAAGVTTVCDGIADALQSDYKLSERPTVVRSVAFRQNMEFKRTDPEKIDVLYHGIVTPMRGLEEAIRSVPLWRQNYRFLIRGPGPEDYISTLLALAEEHNVSDRVQIVPPVKASELVTEANKADIGFFIQPNISLQKRFALPNKFFEYVMAGLALCVVDLPEMARINNDYDLGVLVPDSLEPKLIGEAINSLTPERVDYHKQMSLKAARELNWENEAAKMIAFYDEIVPSPPADVVASERTASSVQ